MRHDVDASSEEQKHRRQWVDQDVSHLLSVLDNAELSSSCSASQTSCSGSGSQTSCVMGDAVDTAAVSCRAPDLQVKDVAESSGERQARTGDEAKDGSSGRCSASSSGSTQTPTCHKTLTAAIAADAADDDATRHKARKYYTMPIADDKGDDDDDDDKSDREADDDYTDADEDEQVGI